MPRETTRTYWRQLKATSRISCTPGAWARTTSSDRVTMTTNISRIRYIPRCSRSSLSFRSAQGPSTWWCSPQTLRTVKPSHNSVRRSSTLSCLPLNPSPNQRRSLPQQQSDPQRLPRRKKKSQQHAMLRKKKSSSRQQNSALWLPLRRMLNLPHLARRGSGLSLRRNSFNPRRSLRSSRSHPRRERSTLLSPLLPARRQMLKPKFNRSQREPKSQRRLLQHQRRSE